MVLLTWQGPSGPWFTPPDLVPAGCSASGGSGTGTGLEPCPGRSSPRPRMQEESAALALSNLIFGFFPSGPPAPLPRLLCSPQPGQDGNFPVAVETQMKDMVQMKNAKQEMALCAPRRMLCHAEMQ